MKIMRRIFALAMCLTLCLVSFAAAATTSQTSRYTSFAQGGYSWTNYSQVSIMSDGTGVKAISVTYTTTNVPSGTVGAAVSLIDSRNTVVGTGGVTYNDSAHRTSAQATTEKYTASSNYKAVGQSYVWVASSNRYLTTPTAETAYLKFPVNAMSNDEFPNEDGIIFGTVNQLTPDGQLPEYIRAMGEDDSVGYFRRDDVYCLPASPEEAAVQMLTRTQSVSAVPLYDVDGTTVIGEFVLG